MITFECNDRRHRCKVQCPLCEVQQLLEEAALADYMDRLAQARSNKKTAAQLKEASPSHQSRLKDRRR